MPSIVYGRACWTEASAPFGAQSLVATKYFRRWRAGGIEVFNNTATAQSARKITKQRHHEKHSKQNGSSEQKLLSRPMIMEYNLANKVATTAKSKPFSLVWGFLFEKKLVAMCLATLLALVCCLPAFVHNCLSSLITFLCPLLPAFVCVWQQLEASAMNHEFGPFFAVMKSRLLSVLIATIGCKAGWWSQCQRLDPQWSNRDARTSSRA